MAGQWLLATPSTHRGYFQLMNCAPSNRPYTFKIGINIVPGIQCIRGRDLELKSDALFLRVRPPLLISELLWKIAKALRECAVYFVGKHLAPLARPGVADMGVPG